MPTRASLRTLPIIAALLTGGLLTGGLLAVGGAQAQDSDATETEATLRHEIKECAQIELNAERLECYDGISLRAKDAGEPAAPVEGEVLQSFSGKDDWDTDTFEVDGPWRAAWETEASILTVELRGVDGELIDVVGQQIGSGAGQSDTLEAGTYSLALRGIGASRVQVVAE